MKRPGVKTTEPSTNEIPFLDISLGPRQASKTSFTRIWRQVKAETNIGCGRGKEKTIRKLALIRVYTMDAE